MNHKNILTYINENLNSEPLEIDCDGNINVPISLCEAKTRAGGLCKAKAMLNGRCRIHGGLSSGPKTPEGKKRSLEALARGRITHYELQKV